MLESPRKLQAAVLHEENASFRHGSLGDDAIAALELHETEEARRVPAHAVEAPAVLHEPVECQVLLHGGLHAGRLEIMNLELQELTWCQAFDRRFPPVSVKERQLAEDVDRPDDQKLVAQDGLLVVRAQAIGGLEPDKVPARAAQELALAVLLDRVRPTLEVLGDRRQLRDFGDVLDGIPVTVRTQVLVRDFEDSNVAAGQDTKHAGAVPLPHHHLSGHLANKLGLLRQLEDDSGVTGLEVCQQGHALEALEALVTIRQPVRLPAGAPPVGQPPRLASTGRALRSR
mmetsp:Transcript_107014/g.307831  ORF Transcript_107014/g.307831 Transcript_107014/m.307831 type:complete len:286 (+) Transcript_107014:420-1277(+)